MPENYARENASNKSTKNSKNTKNNNNPGACNVKMPMSKQSAAQRKTEDCGR